MNRGKWYAMSAYTIWGLCQTGVFPHEVERSFYKKKRGLWIRSITARINRS